MYVITEILSTDEEFFDSLQTQCEGLFYFTSGGNLSDTHFLNSSFNALHSSTLLPVYISHGLAVVKS